ncbi:MAG: hypothetical protein CL850_02500 [Crocinitomicaceae bacterium]|nr:hypothetical protein [Crocinitomicaceae bacterium]|tara:strand:+ start:1465 stop:2478 length:1014 start_codon:yes stop_codon:yes gene_type:complete
MNTKISGLYLYAVQQPKFLIARFSSIGDIIMSAPVVQALRSHYGDQAQIDFITLNKFKDAASLIAGIDTIHTVEKNINEISGGLKKLGYNYLIDLHSNIRTRALARALNIITFRVNKMSPNRIALVLGISKKPVKHFVERSLDLLESLAIKSNINKPWGDIISKSPEVKLPKNFIVLAPGASYEGKQIPESTLEAICSEIDSKFVIVGGDDIVDLSKRVSKKFPKKVIDLCGKLSLSETAHIIKHANVAVGGDTGVMHLATAVGSRLVSVWGCTRPTLGLAPWMANPQSKIILPQGRGNKPCSRHGDKCRFKIFGKDLCINYVSRDVVISAIKDLLK